MWLLIIVRMYLFGFWRIKFATRFNDIIGCDGFDLIVVNVIVVATRFNNNRDLNDFVIFDILGLADRFLT